MMRLLSIRTLTTFLIFFSLSACEWQNDQSTDKTSICSRPEFIDQYNHEIIKNFELISHNIITQTYSDLVDPSVIKEATQYIQISFDHFSTENNQYKKSQYDFCQAEVQINIPNQYLQLAQKYAPLLYKPNQYQDEINNVANFNNINYQANQLNSIIHYAVPKEGKSSIMVDNSELERLNQTVLRILLPIGIKENIMVNGYPNNRDIALQKILSQTGSSNTNDNQDSISPINQANKNLEITEDINIAKKQLADNEQKLSILWSNIDDLVKTNLFQEQQDWAKQFQLICSNTTRNMTNTQEQELAYIHCQTKEIKNRVDYLSGFSISE